MTTDDLILVGRVARAHGIRGQVIVTPFSDFVEQRFAVGATLLVGERATPTMITSARVHQGRPVIGLAGIETMDAAEALAGAELRVPAAELGPLPDGTYYHHELVGCEVHDVEGRRIGPVTRVEGPLERSRLVIETSAGDVLVPMVPGICVEINPAQRLIRIDPPDGLLELNARPRREAQ